LRTRSPDIDNSTPVRVLSLGVGDGRGTDGDSRGDVCGGNHAGVRITVTSSDDGGNAGGDEFVDGVADGGGTTAKAQGSNRRATTAFSSINNPVNSGKAIWNVDVSSNN